MRKGSSESYFVKARIELRLTCVRTSVLYLESSGHWLTCAYRNTGTKSSPCETHFPGGRKTSSVPLNNLVCSPRKRPTHWEYWPTYGGLLHSTPSAIHAGPMQKHG